MSGENARGRLSHPLTVTGVAYPEGTVVEILPAGDPRVQAAWPGIIDRAESTQVAIILPGRDTVTIAHTRQVIRYDGPPTR